jgi:MFS family permease
LTVAEPTGTATPDPRPTRFTSFRPLRHRQFALVWTSALVSNVGSWMQTIAVGVLVTQLTHKAGWAGLVAAATFLPIGVLSPIGGALADRVERRRFLLLTTIGETAFATGLAVAYATGHATPITVAALAFGGGAMAALGFPCYQAMLPDLVGPDDLLAAVSLSAAQFNFGRVIGPVLAGVVIKFGGYSWAFGLNAASFGAVMIALTLIRVPSPMATDNATLWQRIAAGVRVARAEVGCRTALTMGALMAICASPFIALIPAVAKLVFHGGSGTTAIFVTAQGVGAVAGALAVAPLAERFGRQRMLVLNFGLLPLSLVLYTIAPNTAAAAAALVLVGAAYISLFAGLNVVLQLRAPAEFRGRVLSLWMVVIGVIYPIGAVAQGRIGDAVGLRAVTAGGALAMAAAVALFAALRPGRLRTLDDPVSSDNPEAA